MAETQAVVVQESGAPTELSVRDVVAQVAKIQDVMKQVMKDGEHFGKIPGCGDKPALLKPGAEKLAFMFRLAPRFFGDDQPRDLGNGHREYIIKCELYHINTGQFIGSGVGSCSTLESKYRYRTGPKEYTGQPVPKEYWNLRTSDPSKAKELIGGPGYSVGKNDAGAWEICIQGEKAENPDPADEYNTVLKMCKKRAFIDAVLSSTAASDFFTQDIDEKADGTGNGSKPTATPAPAVPKRASESAPPQEQAQSASNGAKISEAQAKRLYAIARQAGCTDDQLRQVIAGYGYQHSRDILKSHYEEICAKFDQPPQ